MFQLADGAIRLFIFLYQTVISLLNAILNMPLHFQTDMHYVYGSCTGKMNAVVKSISAIISTTKFWLICIQNYSSTSVEKWLISMFVLHVQQYKRMWRIKKTLLKWYKAVNMLVLHKFPCLQVQSMSAWQILHNEGLHSYHTQQIQHLDKGKWLEF